MVGRARAYQPPIVVQNVTPIYILRKRGHGFQSTSDADWGEARTEETPHNGKNNFSTHLEFTPPGSIISTCCFEHGKSLNEMFDLRVVLSDKI